MSKDPRRYTPQPYGHDAPWSRRAVEEAAQGAPASALAPADRAAAKTEFVHRLRRWPWAVLVALIVVGVSLLIYDAAIS